MSPAAYGRHLALAAPPISDEQALEFARIFLGTDERAA